MGVRGRQVHTELTEEKIIEKLNKHYLSPNSCKYQISNLYIFANNWESDYLAITKSGYCYEGEVKISRSDFKNDFKKKRKHAILEGRGGRPGDLLPNYFFYAVPKGMITVDEVPEYAGLVYVGESWGDVEIIKKAPKLHNKKYTIEELNLTNKFYYNMNSWKQKAKHDYEDEINHARQLVKEAKTDKDGHKYPYTLGEANDKINELEATIRMLKDDLKEKYEYISELRQDKHELIKKMELLK